MKNIKLGVKLIGGFALTALIALAIGLVGVYEISSLSGHIVDIGTVRMPATSDMMRIEADSNNIMIAMRTLMSPYLTDEERNRQYDNMNTIRERYSKAWEHYESLPKSDEEKQLWDAYVQSHQKLKVANNKAVELSTKLQATGILNPDAFMSNLQLFRGDHYALTTKISEYLLEDKSFEGGDDPNACSFGKWLGSFESSNPTIKSLLSEIHTYHHTFHESVKEIRRAKLLGNQTEAVRVYTDVMLPAASKTFEIFDKMIAEANNSVQIIHELNTLMLTEQRERKNESYNLLTKAVVYNGEVAEESVIQANSAANQGRLVAIIGVIVGLVLALGLGVLLTRSITGPILQGVKFAQAMSQGDFSNELDIDQKDEIGILAKSLNDMIGRLREVVAEVQTASENVASGSEELSSTAQSMSQGATEQAASVEEVSSSMEQMSSNIRQNAENAQETQNIALKAAQDARESGKAVNQAVDAMKNIAEKITIIEEIARQTNLLALNAAIEAARAGEHGKGFAVVAAEVRKLAERSGAAASEISELSSSSVHIAEKAGEMLNSMVPDIQKNAELVQEIAAASNEQNSGAQQINKAIQQLDQVVQQNASASEEMASTSEELSSQAEQLMGTMGFFKVGDQRGRKSRRSAKPSAPKALPQKSRKSVSGRNGVALEMSDEDGSDDDFERF